MDSDARNLLILLTVELAAVIIMGIGVYELFGSAAALIAGGALLFSFAQGFMAKVYRGPTLVEYLQRDASEEPAREGDHELNEFSKPQVSISVEEVSPIGLNDKFSTIDHHMTRFGLTSQARGPKLQRFRDWQSNESRDRVMSDIDLNPMALADELQQEIS